MSQYILCKLPILFSTVKLRLGQNFSQFIHRFKIEIFWVVVLGCTSKLSPFDKQSLKFLNIALAGLLNFFQFLKKIKKWGFFYKPGLHFQIVPNSLKSWETRTFEVPLISYYARSSKAAGQKFYWEKVFWKYAVNLQENTPCQSVISIKLLWNFIEIHFGMGVLLHLCCIFSEHLFLRMPLTGYFWIVKVVFQAQYVCRRERGTQFMIKFPFFKKKKCSYLNNNLLSV